jgi:hypothetical protein
MLSDGCWPRGADEVLIDDLAMPSPHLGAEPRVCLSRATAPVLVIDERVAALESHPAPTDRRRSVLHLRTSQHV